MWEKSTDHTGGKMIFNVAAMSNQNGGILYKILEQGRENFLH